MPLYEYACTSCERQFEVMQRFADDPLTICEECGGALKKLLSAPAFQFKGSGWYVTDYANKDKGDKGSGGGDSSSSGSEGQGDKKAESKGDAGKDKGDKSEKPAAKSDSASSSSST